MSLQIRTNELLAPHTTFHVGGVADYVVEVRDEAELRAALQFAKDETNAPPLMLGGGSNLLINDDGYRGLAILNRIAGITYEDIEDDVTVQVGSGMELDVLVETLVSNGYWGLENLSAIPGTVGATPVQNVGAYGVEVSNRIVSVTAINVSTYETRTFPNEACEFGYRDSFFKTAAGMSWFITDVTFRVTRQYSPVLTYRDLAPLASATALTPQMVRTAIIEIRSKKFPNWREVGTAGSFFKNPTITSEHYKTLAQRYPELPGYEQSDGQVKVSLGWILEHVCNLKGYSAGLVRLYEAQALVLVAERGATASAIDTFADTVAEKIFSLTNIRVEREVKCV